MHDPVLDTVATTLSECGFGTVRFNFRGVGESDGAFDGGQGETEDLRAVLEYVRRDFEPTKLWVGGYSFGAFVVQQTSLMDVERLILIAPPSGGDIEPSLISTHVIVGTNDEICDSDRYLSKSRTDPLLQVHIIDHADHFFMYAQDHLREVVTSIAVSADQ